MLGVSEVSVYEAGELRKKYPIVRPVGRQATIAFRSLAPGLPSLDGLNAALQQVNDST